MYDIGLFLALAPILALVAIFAAIGLAWIIHGDAGAEGMTQRFVIGPLYRAVDRVERLIAGK